MGNDEQKVICEILAGSEREGRTGLDLAHRIGLILTYGDGAGFGESQFGQACDLEQGLSNGGLAR